MAHGGLTLGEEDSIHESCAVNQGKEAKEGTSDE